MTIKTLCQWLIALALLLAAAACFETGNSRDQIGGAAGGILFTSIIIWLATEDRGVQPEGEGKERGGKAGDRNAAGGRNPDPEPAAHAGGTPCIP